MWDFSVRPQSPWTNLGSELGWTGLGLGFFGNKGLGPGLDNNIRMYSYHEWCPNHAYCFVFRLWETTDESLSRRYALYHDS